MINEVIQPVHIRCDHCGDDCVTDHLENNGLHFCCQGCQTVYGLLQKNDLGSYYCYADNPGIKIKDSQPQKFAFLDDPSIVQTLLSFKSEKLAKVSLYLPQIHCASCLWLLERLYKLHNGILSSQVHFLDKRISISFNHNLISLREVVGLLTQIGYEPHISLHDQESKQARDSKRSDYLKLGIVGFCFANIMLISFPEYLGLDYLLESNIAGFLRYINLVLSIPVLLVGAQEFYRNAWNGFKQFKINIDAPIALAISITFLRSLFEILSHTGAGYLDSMSGIIFFMLIGRAIQHKTFASLSFTRDYKSYFPISVMVKEGQEEVSKRIQQVKEDDVIKLYHEDIIPVDGILASKAIDIDYSFVTGESELHPTRPGDVVYAGGRLMNGSAEIIVVKPFAQNTFTALWNNSAFTNQIQSASSSYIDRISQYFSVILLLISAISFIYWQSVDLSKAWLASSSVLIVACPCTLLLASSYTQGFLIKLFSARGFFVKNVDVLHHLQKINHIVFDKTGTLSDVKKPTVTFHVTQGTDNVYDMMVSVLSHSAHPLSKAIVQQSSLDEFIPVTAIKEIAGQGLEAWCKDRHVKLGRASFVGAQEIQDKGSFVYYAIDGQDRGYFQVIVPIKEGIEELIPELSSYRLSLISGDNETSKESMTHLFPSNAGLYYNQTPQMKLDFIQRLQEQQQQVLMVGDGLNDAGALKQSNVGISVVDDHFSFTPASDVILNESEVKYLDRYLRMNIGVRKWVVMLFIYSLLYNAVGISFAVSASLKPIIAAILMPISSISVMLLAYLGTQLLYRRYFGNAASPLKSSVE